MTAAFDSLPPAIRARLASDGVRSLAVWRALGPRRRRLFGITIALVRSLDAMAKAEKATR